MSNRPPLPRLASTFFIALRPDRDDHILKPEQVRAARWPITPGCAVTVAIHGMENWSGEVPGLIAARLVDGGARDVTIQAACHPNVLRDLIAAVQVAMESYDATMARLG